MTDIFPSRRRHALARKNPRRSESRERDSGLSCCFREWSVLRCQRDFESHRELEVGGVVGGEGVASARRRDRSGARRCSVGHQIERLEFGEYAVFASARMRVTAAARDGFRATFAGTSRATGSPCRVSTTSSPDCTRSMSSESLARIVDADPFHPHLCHSSCASESPG